MEFNSNFSDLDAVNRILDLGDNREPLDSKVLDGEEVKLELLNFDCLKKQKSASKKDVKNRPKNQLLTGFSKSKLRLNNFYLFEMIISVANGLDRLKSIMNAEKENWMNTQMFHSSILLLRVLGRKAELMCDEKSIRKVCCIFSHLELSEQAYSGISSRALKEYLNHFGPELCFSCDYSLKHQLPVIPKQINANIEKFQDDYCFSRSLKYLDALERYEIEVKRPGIIYTVRANRIGAYLGRIALYAYKNRLHKLKKRCHNSGLKIIDNIWGKINHHLPTVHSIVAPNHNLFEISLLPKPTWLREQQDLSHDFHSDDEENIHPFYKNKSDSDSGSDDELLYNEQTLNSMSFSLS